MELYRAALAALLLWTHAAAVSETPLASVADNSVTVAEEEGVTIANVTVAARLGGSSSSASGSGLVLFPDSGQSQSQAEGRHSVNSWRAGLLVGTAEHATPSIPRSACQEYPDAGPCSGHVSAWYWDSSEERCKTFLYGGCKGNRNNFITHDECRAVCDIDYIQKVTGSSQLLPRPSASRHRYPEDDHSFPGDPTGYYRPRPDSAGPDYPVRPDSHSSRPGYSHGDRDRPVYHTDLDKPSYQSDKDRPSYHTGDHASSSYPEYGGSYSYPSSEDRPSLYRPPVSSGPSSYHPPGPSSGLGSGGGGGGSSGGQAHLQEIGEIDITGLEHGGGARPGLFPERPAGCVDSEPICDFDHNDYPRSTVDSIVGRYTDELRQIYQQLYHHPPERFPWHDNGTYDDERSRSAADSVSARHGPGEFVCESEVRYRRPGWARTFSGLWQLVLNTAALPQAVRTERCRYEGRRCNFLAPCMSSVCVQRFAVVKMLCADPLNPFVRPRLQDVRIPSGCSCYVIGAPSDIWREPWARSDASDAPDSRANAAAPRDG